MKKVCFDDLYGLTEAVLKGHKTQFREKIQCPSEYKGQHVAGYHLYVNKATREIPFIPIMHDDEEQDIVDAKIYPKYRVGEIVAVGQSYQSIQEHLSKEEMSQLSKTKGWKNKFFVKSELMPYKIRITNIHIERLQDISDEDCVKEGVRPHMLNNGGTTVMRYIHPNAIEEAKKVGFYLNYDEPQVVYKSLVTEKFWNTNPFVWVYNFELV